MFEPSVLNTQSDHELILNAIDTISNRKNRPNIARIYRHLVRFKNISSATCEKVLNELVEQERVIKVTYKGNISYRNAAKWKNLNKNKKNNAVKKPCPEKLCSSVLSGTVAELVVRMPAYFRTGVPCKVLEDHLLAKDGRFTKESIHKLLQKELQQETLVQLDNGNYFLAIDSNSAGSSDSDSNNLLELDEQNNDNSKDEVYGEDLIEEVDEDEDGNQNKKCELIEEDEERNNDGGNNGSYFDDEMVEEEEDEEGYKTADESKERVGNKIVELSGESDDETGIEKTLQQKDRDYRPPKRVNVSTRRDGSGRIVRNKKTRYDPSEYVFPSLKRTYKARQEKIITKQETKKLGKDLTPKEFKKTLLDPIPGFSGTTKFEFTTKLQRCLPIIPLKAVQFAGGTGGDSSLVCYICKESFGQGNKNIGVRCKICNRRAHSACAESEHNSSKVDTDSPSWTCGSCRLIIAQPCSVCNQMLSKMGPLVICGNCKLSYHRSCHKPPIPKEEALNGSWLCNYCVTENKSQDSETDERKLEITKSLAKIGTSITTVQKTDTINQAPPDIKFEEVLIDEAKSKIIIQSKTQEPPLREKKVALIRIKDSNIRRQQQLSASNSSISSPSQTPTPSSSPPSSQLTEETVKEEASDDCQPSPTKMIKEEFNPVIEIPDATDWTPIDVYKYFKDEFNETVGNAFLKQEIDGNSLKLLRRSDVLRGLGLKLGLGLNVLYTVKMLQHRTSDLNVIWASKS
ncbi:hypothetical protein O3M35_002160 [Rhynocoris fuscipes]|uniref:Uncharacterized protein n=1 Tax=Rhynocoris fuscipes TaxID=488301 RepID=A0AAW1CQ57_9HEMI